MKEQGGYMTIRSALRIPLLSRRSVLKSFGVMAAIGLSSRVHLRRLNAAEDVEDQLSMMGWADYINPENVAAWEQATGSKLIYDAYASNDEMYSKLQLSQGNSGYD